MRSRAPLPSLPGCGYRYQQLPVSPWRSGSCLWQDTVVSRSLWRVGGLHFPTHRACARGGDGQRVTPHIGHWLVEGVGTLSYHTSGRHCRSLRASCRQSPWLTQHWEPGRERHLCVNMALASTALTRGGAVQVVSLSSFQMRRDRWPPPPAVARPCNLVLGGGACTYANPLGPSSNGPRFYRYMKQDYTGVGLVGIRSDGSAHQSPW